MWRWRLVLSAMQTHSFFRLWRDELHVLVILIYTVIIISIIVTAQDETDSRLLDPSGVLLLTASAELGPIFFAAAEARRTKPQWRLPAKENPSAPVV